MSANVAVIVSHNGRMRCLRDLFFSIAQRPTEERKFKNCAILELKVDDAEIVFKQIYEGSGVRQYAGELTKEQLRKVEAKKKKLDAKHYHANNMMPTLTISNKTEVVCAKLGLRKDDLPIRFFIVRHGYGYHNRHSNANSTKLLKPFALDADLTFEDDVYFESGVSMAEKAGKKLVDYIILEGSFYVTTFFSSDLKWN